MKWIYNISKGEWEEATPNPFFVPFSEYFTDKDYYEKRKHIVEKITGKKIAITYTREPNSIHNNGQGEFATEKAKIEYVINLTDPPLKEVDMKSAYYHEQGHALWESFVSNGMTICRDYGNSYVVKRWKELGMLAVVDGKEQIVFKDKKGREILPDPILFERFNRLLESHKGFARSTYMTVFNVLEDQRIESLTSRVWLSTKGMFKELRQNLASTCQTFESPVDKLLAVRFTHPSMFDVEHVYHDAIKNVEYTDKFGAIIEVHKLRKDIDEWIEKQLKENMKKVMDNYNAIANGGFGKNEQEELQKLKQEIKQAPDKAVVEVESRINKFKAIEKLQGMDKKQMEQAKKREQQLTRSVNKMKREMSTTNKEWETKRKRVEELERKETEHGSARERIRSELNGSANTMIEKGNSEFAKNPTGNHEACSHENKAELEEVMEKLKAGGLTNEKSKATARREISNILSKLQELEEPEKPAHILVDSNYQNREVGEITDLNATATRYLKKTFDKIVASRVTKVTENGMEVDTESYIARKQRGYGEFMIGEEPQRGLKVIVSIDGSGSMRYDDRINICRRMIATMFKSIEGLPHVQLIANVWSAGRDGDVCITPIRKLSECRHIGIDSHYVYTPTHEALRYARQEITNSGNGKKLFIMLTDGHPQYFDPVSRAAIDDKILVRMARKEFTKLNRLCKNSFALGISTSGLGRRQLTEVFKKNIVYVKNAQQAEGIVLKKFRQQVIDTMKRR